MDSTKEGLRKYFQNQLKKLTPEQKKIESLAICNALIAYLQESNHRYISAFSALRDEVDLDTFIEYCWTCDDVVICLTRLSEEDHGLSVAPIRSWGDVTVHHIGNRKEPKLEIPSINPIGCDLVLVPGLAFDPQGFRLGRGEGYYDVLLPKLTNALRLGICFSAQVATEDIPIQGHDVPVQGLVTAADGVKFLR
jgi:5-formyltetrahydrofolate cyclo-ligase